MKVYNVKPVTKNVAGINVSVLQIGEEGRGREFKEIICPENFEYLEAILPTTGPVKKKGKLINSNSEKGWIARISTKGAYVRGAKGNVSTHTQFSDKISVVAKGYGAFGDAGRTGTWDDLIISTELEEFWLRVKPSREGAHILLFKAGKVTKLTYGEAELLDLDLQDSAPTGMGNLVRL